MHSIANFETNFAKLLSAPTHNYTLFIFFRNRTNMNRRDASPPPERARTSIRERAHIRSILRTSERAHRQLMHAASEHAGPIAAKVLRVDIDAVATEFC